MVANMGILKLLMGVASLLLVGNLLAYAFLLFTPQGKQIADEGYVLKIGSRAWIFAHGKYVFDQNKLRFAHITFWKNSTILTGELVREIETTGVEKVWMSQCESGDSVYAYYDFDRGIAERWDARTDRKAGVSVPFFIGIKFIRIPIPQFIQDLGINL